MCGEIIYLSSVRPHLQEHESRTWQVLNRFHGTVWKIMNRDRQIFWLILEKHSQDFTDTAQHWAEESVARFFQK